MQIDTIRLGFLVGQLNGLMPIATDVSCTYLHGSNNEKVYMKAGLKFGPLQGRLLMIKKSIYGLHRSGAAWHEVLTDMLRMLGYTPSYTDPNFWIKDCSTHYKYIATWVDDLIHWSKNPMKLIKIVEQIFPLKGTGIPEYYLGGNVDRISWEKSHDGYTFTLSARTYITQICKKIEKLFEVELHHYGSPMEANCHPEVDESPFLPELMILKYQMLVGCANWVVMLG